MHTKVDNLFEAVAGMAPPFDLEVERAFLSAYLIAPDVIPGGKHSDANELKMAWVASRMGEGDFHDPFHKFMFRAITKAREVDTTARGMVQRLLSPENRKEAAEYGITNLGYEIGKLLVIQCGRVIKIRMYGNHLRVIGYHRERIEEALQSVKNHWNEWRQFAQSPEFSRYV